MKTKIKVTFDMAFTTEGKCETKVSFTFADRPEIACPAELKALLIREIEMMCSAVGHAGKELFSETSGELFRKS